MHQKYPEIRITHVIDSIALGGGAERLVIDICKELSSKKNVLVQLLVFYAPSFYGHEHADAWQAEIPDKMKPVLCKCSLKFNIFGKPSNDVKDFIDKIKAFNPHIIHSHLIETELLTRTYIFPDVVYFSHLHNNLNLLERKKLFKSTGRADVSNFFIRKWLMNQYEKCNNYFISISNDTLNYLSKNLSEKLRTNIVSLPNAIDTKRFKNISEKKITSDELQLKLISIGSLFQKKNQVFLIEVVKELERKGYSVFLKLLGDGSERTIIEQEIKRLGLDEKVELLGYINDVEKELEWANVYVHAATSEAFGLALVEAMAAGLPVVALNGKGNKDLIENGKNGYLIEKNDPVVFVEKIIAIVANQELYTLMSENAKNFAKQYDIKNYADKLLDVYKSALKP